MSKVLNVPPVSLEENKKPRGRPFKPGNTMGKGRPKGSRNKSSALVKELLGAHTEEITERLIQLTKKKHVGAIKLAMSILCPPQSDEPITRCSFLSPAALIN